MSALLRRFRLLKAAASSSPIAPVSVDESSLGGVFAEDFAGDFAGGDFADDCAGGDFADGLAGGLVGVGLLATVFSAVDLSVAVFVGDDLLASFFEAVFGSVLGLVGDALRSPPRTRAIVLVGECGCCRKVGIGLWVADLGTDLPAPGRGNHTGI